MKFEIGKYYRHTTGHEIAVLCEAETTMFGKCLVGETNDCELIPLGREEDNAVNYIEITKEDWMKNFNDID